MEDDPTAQTDPPARLSGDDGEDRVVAALDFLRGGPSGNGPALGQATLACQKTRLKEWAESLGLLLNVSTIVGRLVRGGQEHDVFVEGDRFFKVTRCGVFGLAPGIDLALVPADQDARRFHLWEATPGQYLERLRLQNLITPGLNRLEGILVDNSKGQLTPTDNLSLEIRLLPRSGKRPVLQSNAQRCLRSRAGHRSGDRAWVTGSTLFRTG